ncbi:MAG: lipocalin [Desulfobacteraceae bacterium]|nr:MAG: lipocalin [Desulfobacteraceae bacterium]
MAPKPYTLLFIFCLACLLTVAGCTGIPEGLTPVSGFDINRYMGKWYEIARLDHRFERGLSHVSADYSLRGDGSVDVVNKGYDRQTGQWKEVSGRAFFVGSDTVGQLKVSFFGPFYGGYNIILLDKEHYQYALVCGPDRSYFWILARTPAIPESVLSGLVASAKTMGFDTDQLIFVTHDPQGNSIKTL